MAETHNTTTRRLFLQSAAAAAPATVMALPALALGADPIFAAIDAHRLAYATWMAALERHSAYEREALAGGLTYGQIKADEPPHLEADMESAGDAELQAAETLRNTVPATLTGIAALVAYLHRLAENDYTLINDETETSDLLASIDAAFRALGVAVQA